MTTSNDKPLDQIAAEFEEWADSVDPATLHFEVTDDLRDLADAVDEVARAQARVNEAVAIARAHGRSWGEVGLALGVSRQAARQRFAPLEEGRQVVVMGGALKASRRAPAKKATVQVKKATAPVKKATVPVKKATAVRKVAPVKKAAPAKKAPRVPDRVPAAAQRIERALPAVITPRAASTSPREERAKGKVAGRARHKPER